jgi:hypothetical protein
MWWNTQAKKNKTSDKKMEENWSAVLIGEESLILVSEHSQSSPTS